MNEKLSTLPKRCDRIKELLVLSLSEIEETLNSEFKGSEFSCSLTLIDKLNHYLELIIFALEEITELNNAHNLLVELTDYIYPDVRDGSLFLKESVRTELNDLNLLNTDNLYQALNQTTFGINPLTTLKDFSEDLFLTVDYIKLISKNLIQEIINPLGRQSKSDRDSEMNKMNNYKFLISNVNFNTLEEKNNQLNQVMENLYPDRIIETHVSLSTLSWISTDEMTQLIKVISKLISPSIEAKVMNSFNRLESIRELTLKNKGELNRFEGYFKRVNENTILLLKETYILISLISKIGQALDQSIRVYWVYLKESLDYLSEQNKQSAVISVIKEKMEQSI